MGKAKPTFDIESLLSGVKKSSISDLVKKQEDHTAKFEEDKLKNKEEVSKPSSNVEDSNVPSDIVDTTSKKQEDHTTKFEEDKLKNLEESSKSSKPIEQKNVPFDTVHPSSNKQKKSTAPVEETSHEQLYNSSQEPIAIESLRMYDDIMNNKSKKINTSDKGIPVTIGSGIKFNIEDIIHKTNRESYQININSKKITVRDFIESAIINYLEKFKS